MSLGQRIQMLRKAAGLSQEALGEQLGVSRQAVSKWEGDGGVPELDTLIAMSRLFGVSIGELLGVEAKARDAGVSKKDEAEQSAASEAQIETILRRYTEENRQQAQKQERNRYRNLSVGAAVVLVLALSFAIRFGNRLTTLSGEISYLRSRVDNVQSNVDYSISSLSDRIREILDEQGNLISTEEILVTGIDVDAETVTLEIHTALKLYTPGTCAQFVLNWIKTDGTEGQTCSDWVEGPTFLTEMTIPMNHHLEPVLRLQDADGVLQEQTMEVRYSGMHPDDFVLDAHSLFKAFSFSVGSSIAIKSENAFGDDVDVVIHTGAPDLVYPVAAELIAEHNGEEILREKLHLVQSKDPHEYYGSMERQTVDLHLYNGDEILVRLQMTDNLGRSFEVTEGRSVQNNNWVMKPMPVAEAVYKS